MIGVHKSIIRSEHNRNISKRGYRHKYTHNWALGRRKVNSIKKNEMKLSLIENLY